MKTQRILLLVTALNSGVALSAMAQTQYHLIDLDSLSGPSGFSQAYGINDSGVVVGETTALAGIEGQYTAAFVWNGAMQPITSNAYNGGAATAINDAGQVVGITGFLSNNFQQVGAGFTWTSSGGLQTIPNASESYFTGINSSGQMSGYAGVSPSTNQPIYCNSPSSSPVGLGFFQKPGGEGKGINDQGVMVGYITPGGAFRYTSGSGIQYIAANGGAYGINNSGQIVGELNGQAVMWNSDLTSQFLPVPANASSSYASLINNNGEVPGKLHRRLPNQLVHLERHRRTE
jgi:hypothetical protein